MSRPGTVVIDAEMGPTLRTALDVLELASELVELVPDWHTEQLEELKNRCGALLEIVERGLKGQVK